MKREALERKYYKEIEKGNYEKARKIMLQIVNLDVNRLKNK